MNNYCLGRNPELWDNPLKFDPTRFIKEKNPSFYKYPVFNTPPRLCLGKHVALMEGKIVAAKMGIFGVSIQSILRSTT